MATKIADRQELRALRGTKRTCQNEERGSRFYDLSRDPITCPVCGTVYELALKAPQPAQAPAPQKKQPRPEPKEYEVEGGKPELEEELAAVEGEEGDETSEGDEVFLKRWRKSSPTLAGSLIRP